MFLIRDIMYCKPGKARAMVEKFRALSKLSETMGFGSMRVMTDMSAERYWTVVSEMEVASLEEYTQKSRQSMEVKEFQDAMKGYHDLIDHGRREIYVVEK
jgi:heme-degrading monooxygenase HmoA